MYFWSKRIISHLQLFPKLQYLILPDDIMIPHINSLTPKNDQKRGSSHGVLVKARKLSAFFPVASVAYFLFPLLSPCEG